MTTITTRSGKGSPLTNNEVDANFTNLNTDKYESGDNVSLGTITADNTVLVESTSQSKLSLNTQITSGTGSLIEMRHDRAGNTVTGFGDDLGTIDHIFRDSAGNLDVGVRVVGAMGGSSGDNTSGQERTSYKISTLKGSSTLSDVFEITRAGDIGFYDEAGSNVKLLWDASEERLGLGTTSPNVNLDIESSSEAALDLHSTAGKVFRLRSTTNSEFIIRDSSAAVDRFTIQSGGNVIINESGTGSDFRVESDNSSHMLFVDAGNDRVGVNTSAPQERLTVKDGDILIDNNANSTLYLGKGAEGVDGVTKIKSYQSGTDSDELGLALFVHPSATGSASASEAVRISHQHQVDIIGNNQADGATLVLREANNNTSDTLGTIFFGNNSANNLANITSFTSGSATSSQLKFNVTQSGGTEREALNLSDSANVFNDGSIDMDFRVESNGNSHMLFVDAGNDTVVIGSGSITAPSNYDFLSYGSAAAGRSAFVHGSGDGGIVVSGSAGGSAASVIFGNDWGSDGATFSEEWRLFMDGADDSLKFNYAANAATAMSLSSGGTMTYNFAAIFNESGGDNDFRVESDLFTHALFVDAGNNRIGLFDSSPDRPVHLKSSGTRNYIKAETTTASISNEAGFDIKTPNTNLLIGALGGGTPYTYFYDLANGYGNLLKLHTAEAGAVFNDDSHNLDFRVESDNNANMLFVDAGNDKLGVQTSSPVKPISLGSRTGNNLSYIFGTSQTINENSGIFVSGNSADTTDMDYGLHLANNNNADGAYSPVIGFSALSESNGYNHTYAYIAGYRRDNGADTNWNTGGIEFMTSSGTGPYTRLNIDYLGGLITTPTTGGDAVFNESSADADFRVESDNNANMLVVDAGNDRVGVGTSAPDSTLEVNGTVNINGIYHTEATQTFLTASTANDLVSVAFGSAQTGVYVKIKYRATKNNGGVVSHVAGEELFIFRSDSTTPAVATTSTNTGSNFLTFTTAQDTGNNKLTVKVNPGAAANFADITYTLEVIPRNVGTTPTITHL